MTSEPRRHIRVSEFRFQIPRRNGEGTFPVPRHQLAWTDAFIDEETGDRYELAYVLEHLEAEGWDVHDLLKGRGTFRETVERLPLPYGGQFAPGDPTTRDA
ncbi:MAG: hypothetical protein OXR64_14055 [Chloroflexota bacterium]|nr:hypothetical protein [Chloroflexota bacterium]MDE2920954.1 hypothetical protein [Chloroflexota bacterium]